MPKLRVELPAPDAWTLEELEFILAAAAAEPGDVCGIAAGRWWPAFLLTLYDTGLRFNALTQRTTSDLDTKAGWMTIPASDQKQGKAQVLKLHDDTLQLIAATEPDSRTWLFPWPYRCHKKIRDHFRAILQRAGLPHGNRDLFHKLRRTAATAVMIAASEDDARVHLGHSSVEVTRRYIDVRQLPTAAAADLIRRPSISQVKGGNAG